MITPTGQLFHTKPEIIYLTTEVRDFHFLYFLRSLSTCVFFFSVSVFVFLPPTPILVVGNHEFYMAERELQILERKHSQ